MRVWLSPRDWMFEFRDGHFVICCSAVSGADGYFLRDWHRVW